MINITARVIVFVISIVFVLCLGGCGKESASVGIIGGADGPTAISVSSDISWLSVCVFIAVVVVLVALIILRNKRNK